MKIRTFVVLVGAIATAGCFSAVPENPIDGGAGGGTAGAGGGSSTTGGGSGGDSGSVGGGSGGGAAGGVGGGSSDGGTGGGSAVDGGLGDGGVPCGCKNVLGCQVGDSPIACGSNGGTCAMCGMGEQCVGGACMAGTCSPTTCTGCCSSNFCVTSAQQSPFACGKGGPACASCMMGQTCTNGACVTAPACGPATCPNGCCVANQCIMMQTRFSCGLAGVMCAQCGPQGTCNAGVCAAGPNDGGMPPAMDGGSVGAPCTSGAGCAGMGAICIQETQFGQMTGYPGGYCTAQCSAANACVSGECVTETVFGQAQSTCRASCAASGTPQSNCRTGYVCVAAPGGTTGYCRPNCANGGLAACGAGQTCGATGFCN